MSGEEMLKTVLTLDVSITSVEPILKSRGYKFVSRVLQSKPENWKKIANAVESLNLDTDLVVGKFTEYTIFLAALPAYEKALEGLIKQVQRVGHVVYIYEANLDGKFSCETNKASYYESQDLREDFSSLIAKASKNQHGELFDTNNEELKIVDMPQIPDVTFLQKWCSRYILDDHSDVLGRMSRVVEKLTKELTVAPYRVLTDVELGTAAFVEARIRGLVLRVYVPAERLWSTEVEKMVRLFQEYASSVQGVDVQLVQEHTDIGSIYSLYSKSHDTKLSDVPALFQEFTEFLELCAQDSEKAANLLKEAQVPPEIASKIIRRYVKEAKRLALDIRHEAESKLLNIRHLLESELLEASVVNSIVSGISDSVLNDMTPSNALTVLPIKLSQNITINNQYIDTVNGIVSSQLNGRVNYNEFDNQILSLIENNSRSKAESIELQSALAELKDPGIKVEAKTPAWQKLRSFLAFAADKAGDIGVSLLVKYIESYTGTAGG